jgi:lipopolysaccharide transport system ATP-binding protein
MSKPVIEIKNLSKSYMIGHEGKAAPGTLTLRDSISSIIKKPVELFTGHKLKKEKFWALKDLDINIEQGDVVGLIGKNGSGKSTLLKILSRIAEPTSGEIIMRGKAASLLEVGTGFHPELTGRENIYFNGSILGMKKKEIESKFDEIVAFSGVEKFLDTPVKFYSSGMYVRLAFAVAAHLEPDILIVDEVLAVGDADFQQKSLGKMKDVTKNKKRTVIFVSHSMESIRSICNKCIWLSEGRVVASGDTDRVVEKYMHSASDSTRIPISKRKDRNGSGNAEFYGVDIQDNIAKNKTLEIDLKIKNKTENDFNNFKLSLDLFDSSGVYLSNINNALKLTRLRLMPGENKFKIIFKNISLVPGNYYINLFMAKDQYNSEIFDWVENAFELQIKDYDYYSVGLSPHQKGKALFLDFDIKSNNEKKKK